MKYNNLTPFKWCILQNFPFIEATFDAIDNYQLWCKVVEYLNKTIDKINILGLEVEKFENYFNTLDVQDEINNKLDEMANNGTLQEIISNYLNSKAIFGFNTINDLKQATNLINGSYAKTLGFYNINDKGGAYYKIRNITNTDVVDNMTKISLLDNNLIAELVIKNPITPEVFGAKGNGIDDDTQNIKAMINYAKNNNLKILLQNKYLISEPIIIDYATDINGIYDKTGFIQNNLNSDVLVISRKSNVDIRGISIKNIVLTWSDFPNEGTCGLRIKQNIVGEKDGWGIHESLFERIKIINPYIGIINEVNEPSWNVDFKSIRIDFAQFQVADINAGFGINMEIIAIGNSKNVNVTRGLALNANFGGTLYFDLEDWQGKAMACTNGFFALHVKHIHLERCTFDFSYTAIITTSTTTVIFDDIEIYACNFTATNAYVYLISVYGNSSTSNACVEVKKVLQSNNTIPETGHFVVIGTAGEIQSCYVWFVGGFPEIYFPSGTSLNRCYYGINPIQ